MKTEEGLLGPLRKQAALLGAVSSLGLSGPLQQQASHFARPSTQVNAAVFGVFLTLEATEVILFIGFFAANTTIIKIGGYVGVLTALVAWYTSAAGVINGMRGTPVVPVGKPFGARQEARQAA